MTSVFEEIIKHLDDYQKNQHLLQPLIEVYKVSRLHSKHNLSYLFAKLIMYCLMENTTFLPLIPTDKTKFLNDILYNLSITCYYTEKKDEGMEICDKLILNPAIESVFKNNIHFNQLFYIEPLTYDLIKSLDLDLPFIENNIKWNPLNPSILQTSSGYNIICRTVNYIKNGYNFKIYHPKNISITRNYFLTLDNDLNTLSQSEIIESLDRVKFPKDYRGLEDCRIFSYQGHHWFTCSNWDTHFMSYAKISLCRLASDNSTVDFLLWLQGPNPTRHEKNWLPFIKDNTLLLIYSFSPFVIYRPDLDTGLCYTVIRHQHNYDLSRFRGSASPIPFNDGYLLIIHETLDHSIRYYYHRFLWLDADLAIRKLSYPFYFKKKGTEYCSGLSYSNSNDNELIIAIGVDDREAYLLTVGVSLVNSMLHDLPTFF